MNAKTFSVNRIASHLLNRFLQQRIVAEEPVVAIRVVKALEECSIVREMEETPRSSSTTYPSLEIPQIGVL